MMKKLAAAFGIAMLLACRQGMAAETVYLNDDSNFPMVSNTGGIYNDGHTGVFMDMSSIGLEDLFKDGLGVKADFLNVKNGASLVQTVRFRMADDQRAWIAMEDGWHEVTGDSNSAERAAIQLIRDDMGSNERRDKYMERIHALWEEKVKAYYAEQKKRNENSDTASEDGNGVEPQKIKKFELGTVIPDSVVENKDALKTKALPVKLPVAEKSNDAPDMPVSDRPVPAVAATEKKIKAEPMAVKIKGNVQTEETAKKNDKGEITEQVEIVITSQPVVEIVSEGKSD